MNSFLPDLEQRLAALRKPGLYRELRRLDSPQSIEVVVDGRRLLNFSSNDYLGLANDPILRDAARQALERFGAGAGASRLVCGSLPPHAELEQTLAEFKGTEAALAFSSGYVAALGTIPALVEKGDIVILDKLAHACLVDAARLSGAKLRVFTHNDLEDLERILRWASRQPGPSGTERVRRLVVTESLFSMDGDRAPLGAMVELKERYGAWLLVDEAHATGLLGVHRRGGIEAAGVAGQVEVQMGTLSKALGSTGGFICGSRALIEWLINRARSFIFSTAPTPASAAAATAAVRFIQSSAGQARAQQLWDRVGQLHRGLLGMAATRWKVAIPVQDVGDDVVSPSPEGGVRSAECGIRDRAAAGASASGPIIPLIIGAEDQAVRAASQLRQCGILIPAIRYPAVARGAARLRLTVSAAHTAAQVHQLLEALSSVWST